MAGVTQFPSLPLRGHSWDPYWYSSHLCKMCCCFDDFVLVRIHCSLVLLFCVAAADFLCTWLVAKLQLRMCAWLSRCVQSLYNLKWLKENNIWQSRSMQMSSWSCKAHNSLIQSQKKKKCNIHLAGWRFPEVSLFCFPPQHRTRKVPSERHRSWKWSRWEPLCCLQSIGLGKSSQTPTLMLFSIHLFMAAALKHSNF